MMQNPTDEAKAAMVDERVCRILRALPPRDESMGADALIFAFLADEWACLDIAARVLLPAFGLDPEDDALAVRLQRAAHEAMKAECRRIAGGGEGP
jgi:hypothetical protein